MKCQEVNELLVAYLDGEVTPSERTLIQAHLAGCDACQEELAVLSALQSRVSQFLQIRVAQAAPSPQAWSRLQERLTLQPPLSWLERLAARLFPLRPAWRLTLASLALLCLLQVASIAFYPGGLVALAEGGIERIVRIVWLPASEPSPTSPPTQEAVHNLVPLPEAQRLADFHIYVPIYVPAGLTLVGAEVGGPNSVGLRYEGDGMVRCIDLMQTRLIDEGKPPFALGLPEELGEKVVKGMVGGAEALWVESWPGAVATMVWEHDGFAFTMLVSSWQPGLSIDEAIKIAESMVPAEAGEGEPPFQPPLNRP